MLGVYASALSEKRNAFLRLLNTKSFRERNKKVAMHPCREDLCVPDARRGGTRGHTWPSRGARRARRGTRWQGRGRAWALGQRGILVCSPVLSLSSKRRSWEHTEP